MAAHGIPPTAMFHAHATHAKDLSDLALQIWQWSLKRNIVITAEYLPGKENVIADQESCHHRDASDWKLDTRILIQSPRIEMGTIQCRSFCSMTQQTYFSWKADRAAAAVNAMVQEWGALTPYAFPRFILIGRVLLKIKCRKHV